MPVVVWLLVEIAPMLVALVLSALTWSLAHWLRPLLRAIAATGQTQAKQRSVWKALRRFDLGGAISAQLAVGVKWLRIGVAAALRDVENFIAVNISRAANSAIPVAARFFHGIGALGLGIGAFNLWLFEEIYNALHHMRHVALPGYVDDIADPARDLLRDGGVAVKQGAKATLKELARTAVRAEATATALDELLIRARKGIDSALRDIPGVGVEPFADTLIDWAKAFGQLWGEAYDAIFPKVNDLWDNYRIDWNRRIRALEEDVFGTAAAGIDALRRAVRGLEDFTNNVGDVLTNAVLGSLATAAGLVGLAALLERLIPELMCRNTRAVGKRLCKIDTSLIDAVLALTLAYELVIDPETIARAALAAEEALEPIIRKVAA